MYDPKFYISNRIEFNTQLTQRLYSSAYYHRTEHVQSGIDTTMGKYRGTLEISIQ